MNTFRQQGSNSGDASSPAHPAQQQPRTSLSIAHVVVAAAVRVLLLRLQRRHVLGLGKPLHVVLDLHMTKMRWQDCVAKPRGIRRPAWRAVTPHMPSPPASQSAQQPKPTFRW